MFKKKRKQKIVWTNGAYWIEQIAIEDYYIYGTIVKSMYEHVYAVGYRARLPIYHLATGEQQFFSNERELKLKRILK